MQTCLPWPLLSKACATLVVVCCSCPDQDLSHHPSGSVDCRQHGGKTEAATFQCYEGEEAREAFLCQTGIWGSKSGTCYACMCDGIVSTRQLTGRHVLMHPGPRRRSRQRSRRTFMGPSRRGASGAPPPASNHLCSNILNLRINLSLYQSIAQRLPGHFYQFHMLVSRRIHLPIP